jgi:hypothetical protein
VAEKWTIQSLGEALAVHIKGDESRDEKLSELYKTVVIGNGTESLVKTVSRNTDWINGVKKIGWIVLTAFVGVIVTGGITITYMVVRIYPILQNLDKLELLK